jgi:hypothetical protein
MTKPHEVMVIHPFDEMLHVLVVRVLVLMLRLEGSASSKCCIVN